MAGPDRRSSTGGDRRASARISIEEKLDNDYDLEAMGISDGFRPSNTVGFNGMMSQQREMAPEIRGPPIRPRPSSVSKPKATDNFALRHDGEMSADVSSDSNSASGSSSMPTRASSVSTEMAYVRPESPYRGPTGPSHPYQVYPQESRLARTASMATTSTAPITERSYAGPSGPTHPYGMYPQNIVAESEAGDASPSPPPVPVGFPGLNNNYQRRLGPDGEEAAGIIGPDGHTEELPPYTQYPDDAIARKTRPNVALTVPNEVSDAPEMAMASGAGGIGLATRNPEFASREDLNSPQSRSSIMSDLSSHNVNTGASNAAVGNEKAPLKSWQKAARRKVCGIIPVWVFGIIAISFIFFGIILATVLTLLKPKHSTNYNDQDGEPPFEIQGPSSTPATTLTTTYDATPLTSVPTGTPDLPTGNFILPINPPSLSQSTCLEATVQSNAWSCNVPSLPEPLQMTLTPLAGSPDPLSNIEMTLDFGIDSLTSFTYGAQAPQFDEQQVLRLVNDVDETVRGPAWWVQMPYNKLVILHEGDLTVPQQKRQLGQHGVGDFSGRKGVLQTDDVAWFCYWNGTVLEAFIYPNQTTAYGSRESVAATTTWAPWTPTGSYGGAMPTGQNTGNPYQSPNHEIPWTPQYPRVVKIEEHRMSQGPNVIPPYCTKTLIVAGGGAQPILNSTGQPTMVYLDETESTTFSKRSLDLEVGEEDSIKERSLISPTKREPGSEKQCGCVWLYQ